MRLAFREAVPDGDGRTFSGGDPDSKEFLMLWALIVILLVLWLLGFLVIPVGNALIHALLVIALIVLIYQLVTGRRTL
jgi:hypothetical protein